MESLSLSKTTVAKINTKYSQSSIGNVKTLRSKLQARRVTLSEAIEKENLFLKGSQRLESITSDQRTRDQASMQCDFAESKIKSLQSELMKINSSLHAYQAESAQGVQVPIIPLAMKTTGTLDMTQMLSKIVRKHYHTDPEDVEDSIQQFSELRNSVPRTEEGIRQLYAYYNQLMMVSKRLLHSKLDHDCVFVWYDGISGLPVAQQSTVFERASIMFNIGALYSQMAAKVDRSSLESLDTAMKLLENAIGVFEYTKNKFSHAPTMDMTSEVLSLISDLMRAQAQEMVWEKEILKGLNEDDITDFIDYAHKTKSVAECYRPVRELVDVDVIKEYLPGVWVSLIKIKEAHYKALAHYYAGLTHWQLASIYEGNGHISENVRTEILFLYSDCPQEMLTNHPKLHLGIAKSHINCAALSHEYALKFCTLCRDLHHVGCLTEMLAAAEVRTQQVREAIEREEGVKIIAPTIIPCETQLSARIPNFKQDKAEDLFASLGPISSFNGERSWSPPHSVLLAKDKGTFGFTVRGSQPVQISGVDSKGPAEKADMRVKDWILAVNGEDVKYKSHDDVVAMVKACRDEVTLEMSRPELVEPA